MNGSAIVGLIAVIVVAAYIAMCIARWTKEPPKPKARPPCPSRAPSDPPSLTGRVERLSPRPRGADVPPPAMRGSGASSTLARAAAPRSRGRVCPLPSSASPRDRAEAPRLAARAYEPPPTRETDVEAAPPAAQGIALTAVRSYYEERKRVRTAYSELCTLAGGKAAAERLINDEAKKAPGASPLELMKSAIHKARKDRR